MIIIISIEMALTIQIVWQLHSYSQWYYDNVLLYIVCNLFVMVGLHSHTVVSFFEALRCEEVGGRGGAPSKQL